MSIQPNASSSSVPIRRLRIRCCFAASRTRNWPTRQLKIIVADPRRTDSCELADLFLQIQPGTDVLLFHGMLHLMLWEGWTAGRLHPRPHQRLRRAQGRGARRHTATWWPRPAASAKQDLVTARACSPRRTATLSLYCQGLNQSSSGTAKNAALINLHLATAQIGKPGAGPFSLTGQPNAMGGREVGGMANLMSGHRDLANADAPRRGCRACGACHRCRSKPGKTAIEMFQAAADGEIKALWICCTNPAQSLPDQALVRRALERAELVIVQEAFGHTATCAYADLLLPAASWGEKEGTVTNSERRISRVRAAVAPPGQARPDWAIAVDLAQTPAATAARARRPGRTCFAYTTTESIWNEHRESTRGRDLDITGLSYPLLEQSGPQQWPMPEGAAQGKVRLYEDGIFPTPDGRARFVDTPFKPVAEPRDARYPFALEHRTPARPVAWHEPHRHAGPTVRPCRRSPRCRCIRRTWHGG